MGDLSSLDGGVMDQIKFRPGEKQAFISTRSFALGNTGAQVPKGSEILFDGSTVEFAGMSYPFPQLRGAIKTGWLVPAKSYDETNVEYDRPQAANIQVRHATQGGNPMQPQQKMTIATTQSDEREVGSVKNHAAQTKQGNTTYQRGMPLNAGGTEIQSQDGVAVRTLKTASGQKAKEQRTVLTADSVGQALQAANKSGVIDPGQGITESEMLDRMSEGDRETWLAQKEAAKAKYMPNEPPQARMIVSTVKSTKETQSEGMTVKNDVGHGIEIADMAGTASGPAKQSVRVEDGITFRNTNGPERKPQPHPRSEEAQRPVMAKDGTEDVRRTIAKALCSDFPTNYDFAQPAKKKLARLQADYEDRPDVLKAVFAAESDEFKSVLVSEFPRAFGT